MDKLVTDDHDTIRISAVFGYVARDRLIHSRLSGRAVHRDLIDGFQIRIRPIRLSKTAVDEFDREFMEAHRNIRQAVDDLGFTADFETAHSGWISISVSLSPVRGDAEIVLTPDVLGVWQDLRPSYSIFVIP